MAVKNFLKKITLSALVLGVYLILFSTLHTLSSFYGEVSFYILSIPYWLKSSMRCLFCQFMFQPDTRAFYSVRSPVFSVFLSWIPQYWLSVLLNFLVSECSLLVLCLIESLIKLRPGGFLSYQIIITVIINIATSISSKNYVSQRSSDLWLTWLVSRVEFCLLPLLT